MTNYLFLHTTRRTTPRRRAALFLIVLVLALANSVTAQAQDLSRVQEIRSAGGIKAWLIENHSVPLIAMRFGFHGGSVQDPAGKEGLTSLMADMFSEGGGDLDRATFKKQLDQLASRFSVSASRDILTGGLVSITRRFSDSTDLVRAALIRPRFDAYDLERVKDQLLTELAFEEREANNVAFKYFYASLYGNHEYGRPVKGTARSIGQITTADLTAQHRRMLAKSSLKVVFVGDIDEKSARRTLDHVFGALPERSQRRIINAAKPQIVRKTIPWNGPRATAVYALPAPSQSDRDFLSALVLNQMLGSGNFDARLTQEVRVKRGLTYSISSRILTDRYSSLMLGTFSTKTEEMKSALNFVRDVLVRMAKEGPTRTELNNAKSGLIGSYLLNLNTSSKLAGHLLGNMLDGFGPDYFGERARRIAKLDRADIQKAARHILRDERFAYVIVGGK